MSAKKSFDLQRKPVPVTRSASKKPAARSSARPAQKPRASLRQRREAERNLTGGVILFVLAGILGATVYGLWRPEVRISDVRAEQVPGTPDAVAVVRESLAGTYFGVVPRDSVFFYPEKELRAALLDAYPSLSAISVSRDSFTSLSVTGTGRAAAFYWCGESAASFSISSTSCFEADAEGLVFAHAEGVMSDSGSTPPLLRIYAPLDSTESATYPVRSIVIGAQHLPSLLQFVKAVKTLGVPVLSTFIEDDEAQLFVTPETRIKYVLGKEEEAAKNAEAAFPNLNLLNGTIEYVDLRFEGKVYVKRYE